MAGFALENKEILQMTQKYPLSIFFFLIDYNASPPCMFVVYLGFI